MLQYLSLSSSIVRYQQTNVVKVVLQVNSLYCHQWPGLSIESVVVHRHAECWVFIFVQWYWE